MKLALCLFVAVAANVGPWTNTEIEQLQGCCNSGNEYVYNHHDPNWVSCGNAEETDACGCGRIQAMNDTIARQELIACDVGKARMRLFLGNDCMIPPGDPDFQINAAGRRLDEEETALDSDEYFKMLIDRADATTDASLDLEESLSAKGHGHGPHGHGPHGHGPHGHGPHGHSPHGHSPHGHNPHSHYPHNHNPHSHNPHSHNPHVHTNYPTPSPTNYPTPSPTNYPTPPPTNYPTPFPTPHPCDD